jgi:two-component system, OmpR family, sensor kinase
MSAAKRDPLTAWWRNISLRAKVTGVTVAVLVIGLVAAGFGTMVFLRTTLLTNLDTTLLQLVGPTGVNQLITVTTDDGAATFERNKSAVATDYFVAIYAPGTGERLITAGGEPGAPQPNFPATFALDTAYTQQETVFELTGEDDTHFHATVSVTQVPGTSAFYTQMVVMPLAPTDRVVATYLGIFSLLAIFIVIASAFLVRWVVTLTFRSLGAVERTAELIAAGDFSQRMSDVESETTEVGRLKRALNAMLGRVDESLSQRDATVRQMRRFIGDASHELRTPLVTVRGYAELYRMGAIPEGASTAQAMERIEKEAMRMGAMVEDLLALARLDERRDIEVVPLDLRPIARDAALDVGASAPQRTVTVIDTTAAHTRIPDAAHPTPGEAPEPETPAAKRRGRAAASARTRAAGTLARLRRRPRTGEDAGTGELAVMTEPVYAMPPIVMGEENRVRQVVANLLGNAQRFSAPDSPIELRVGTDETAGLGWIEVIDHGEGIPEQIREQIFQRFWRADTSRARETGGSGLGLSIVASIVDALHGSVEVSDSAGGGATFRVSLPLAVHQDVAAHLLIETQPLPRLSRAD